MSLPITAAGTDFRTWKRENLEQLATELTAEVVRHRTEKLCQPPHAVGMVITLSSSDAGGVCAIATIEVGICGHRYALHEADEFIQRQHRMGRTVVSEEKNRCGVADDILASAVWKLLRK